MPLTCCHARENLPGRAAKRQSYVPVESNYYYRRSLTMRELLPAFGAAAGAAVVTFYLVKLFLERTPLEVGPRAASAPRLTLHRSARSLATAKQIGRR
jgi:hypothetical protein